MKQFLMEFWGVQILRCLLLIALVDLAPARAAINSDPSTTVLAAANKLKTNGCYSWVTRFGADTNCSPFSKGFVSSDGLEYATHFTFLAPVQVEFVVEGNRVVADTHGTAVRLDDNKPGTTNSSLMVANGCLLVPAPGATWMFRRGWGPASPASLPRYECRNPVDYAATLTGWVERWDVGTKSHLTGRLKPEEAQKLIAREQDLSRFHDAKGSVEFWIENGLLTKMQVNLSAKVSIPASFPGVGLATRPQGIPARALDLNINRLTELRPSPCSELSIPPEAKLALSAGKSNGDQNAVNRKK